MSRSIWGLDIVQAEVWCCIASAGRKGALHVSCCKLSSHFASLLNGVQVYTETVTVFSAQLIAEHKGWAEQQSHKCLSPFQYKFHKANLTHTN